MPTKDEAKKDRVVIKGTAPRVAPPRPRGLRKPPGKQLVSPTQLSQQPNDPE